MALRNCLNTASHFKRLRSWFPPLNFISLHYIYFLTTVLLTSIIFYCSSTPRYSITYTDSLFLVVSAMTEAGLNTVNLSQMTTFQQVLLFLLIMFGGAIWVSIWTVVARKRAFERRFGEVLNTKRLRGGRNRHRPRSSSRQIESRGLAAKDGVNKASQPVDKHEFESRHSGPRDPTSASRSGDSASVGLDNMPVQDRRVQDRRGEQSVGVVTTTSASPLEKGDASGMYARGRAVGEDGISHGDPVSRASPSPGSYARRLNFASNTHSSLAQESRRFEHPLGSSGDQEDLDQAEYPHYLTRHTTGRNAQFYGLSRAEREHLGGVEYRAITLLAYVVPIYFVLWQLLGCLSLGAYMANNKRSVIETNGINPWWLGVFNGASAFNNSGMSLLDANLIPFQSSTFVLLTMGLLILAGNTAYPLFLRLIFWSMLKLLCLVFPGASEYSETKSTLRFILAYPRRVYTNLFPSAATFWLLFMVITLNGIDWAAFELLNIGNPATNSIPAHYRVLDGLFQAIAVRSGGFYIISITSLRIGLQVLYVIMMYISVYPVVITMRHSNVYEERSLGIYAEDGHVADDIEEQMPSSRGQYPTEKTIFAIMRTAVSSLHSPFTLSGEQPTHHQHTNPNRQFIRQQIRGQLAHDLWLLVLAILLISCIEVSNFDRDPVTYSVFNIAFEVVSGYGCVGISTGLPNEAYSFSGGWKAASKLVLCAVMLRGRHRGLPVALDRAVRLPGHRGGTSNGGGGGGDGGGGVMEHGEDEENDEWIRRSMSRKREM